MARTARKWTPQEEDRLLRQIKAFPQNLSRCFMIVAEEIDRTPLAVANHWYTVLSKKPGAQYTALATVSPVHVSRNRKNGIGVESTMSLWRRFINLLSSLGI